MKLIGRRGVSDGRSVGERLDDDGGPCVGHKVVFGEEVGQVVACVLWIGGGTLGAVRGEVGRV